MFETSAMLQEGIAVRTVGEWQVQQFGVGNRLLHAVADPMVVVLRLDDRDRDARLVGEDVIDLLSLAALDRLAANDHAASGEVDLLPKLRHEAPLRAVGPKDRWSHELGADIRFGQFLLVHSLGWSGIE